MRFGNIADNSVLDVRRQDARYSELLQQARATIVSVNVVEKDWRSEAII
jgi:hypothetical protein